MKSLLKSSVYLCVLYHSDDFECYKIQKYCYVVYVVALLHYSESCYALKTKNGGDDPSPAATIATAAMSNPFLTPTPKEDRCGSQPGIVCDCILFRDFSGAIRVPNIFLDILKIPLNIIIISLYSESFTRILHYQI